MDWAKRSGWGDSCAVVVVDLALYWTRPSPMGSNVDSVVESSLAVIEAARSRLQKSNEKQKDSSRKSLPLSQFCARNWMCCQGILSYR